MTDAEGAEPYITRGQFRQWRNRTALGFLILAVVASAAAWKAQHVGNESANGLAENSRTAAFKTCQSGGELRITVAKGFDSLRTVAITGLITGQARLAFIATTQPPIDDLLTQAAGRTYHAPLPPGAVSVAVIKEVTALSNKRCHRRTDSITT